MPKLSKKARFLSQNPICCFCGGTKQATTVDHVPPKACFPPELFPDSFEFPSCGSCNIGTAKYDQIFGYYLMLLDFNEENRTPADRKRIANLKKAIEKNYPDALPDPLTSQPIYQTKYLITPSPVAYSVGTKEMAKEAMRIIGSKLTHALYYRETGVVLKQNHQFFSSTYQLQRAGTEDLTEMFKKLLPRRLIGGRPNIKKYGHRFAYMSGYKPEADLFLFAAQFGYGLVLWGMALGSIFKVPDSNEALRKMNWQTAGLGFGNASGSVS